MSALTDRDFNVQPTSQSANTEKQTASGEENKQQEMEGKQVLEHKSTLGIAKKDGTYVSPSDAIMSPASHKLAGFKQRQINKQQNGKNSTSRMLFARTPSSVSGGEDDVDAGVSKPEEA